MSRKKNCARSGFTLIELLVVIAIIAILAAILFPVFAQAKESARKSTSVSNAKQMQLAIIQYTDANEDTLPLSNFSELIKSYSVASSEWQNAIFSYVKSKEVYRIPSDPTRYQEVIPNCQANVMSPSYARTRSASSWLMNYNITTQSIVNTIGERHSINQSQISAPSDFFVFTNGQRPTEKGQEDYMKNADPKDITGQKCSLWTARYVLDRPFGIGRVFNPYGNPSIAAPHHKDGAVFAFSDGHVKYITVNTDNLKGKPPVYSSFPNLEGKFPYCKHARPDSMSDDCVSKNGAWNLADLQ